MIKVTVGCNTQRKQVIVPESSTLNEIFKNNDIDTSVGAAMLDGVPIRASEINMTLAELGVTDACYLIVTAKSDGATR